MTKLEFTIDIVAPPNRVFAFFVPQRMPYWYGAEMESCFEVQGGAAEFQAGQKVRIAGHVGRREVSLTTVVTAYEWGRLLEWRFQDSYGVRGMQRWELEPATFSSEAAAPDLDGIGAGTRVRLKDHYELPGRLGRVADWLLTRHAVARRDRLHLDRLKRLAERR